MVEKRHLAREFVPRNRYMFTWGCNMPDIVRGQVAHHKSEWLKRVQAQYPERRRRYLAEKERFATEHGLHKYFSWDDYFKPHQNFFLNWLQNNIQNKNAAILDVGCGVGFLALRLHDLGYDNYYGIDINDSSIAVGIKLLSKFNLNPRLQVGQAEQTSFGDGQFDVVCVLDASYVNCFNMVSACKEIHRILKPKGHLVMDVAYTPLECYKRLYNQDEMRKHLSDFSDVKFMAIPKREKLKYGVVARK